MDVLAETILSQNTSDTNSHRAFLSLKNKYPRWEMLLTADPREIVHTIKSGGLASVKSRVLKNLIISLSKQKGKADLEFLKDMQKEKAYQFLLDIKGVGPKTAACTLLFGAGIPIYPVDTHVYRISSRLGWVALKENRSDFQERFRKHVPEILVYPLHLNLIAHGRRICHPGTPDCGRCCMLDICKWKEKNK
jgi:endonuclease-3